MLETSPATTAPHMLKGSSVYTTKTTNRKKGACPQRAVSAAAPPPPPSFARLVGPQKPERRVFSGQARILVPPALRLAPSPTLRGQQQRQTHASRKKSKTHPASIMSHELIQGLGPRPSLPSLSPTALGAQGALAWCRLPPALPLQKW